MNIFQFKRIPACRACPACPAYRARQVFQTQIPITNVKICDIHDAYQATTKLSYIQKKDYFASLGIDLDRVEKYLKPVLVLEYLYKKAE